MSAPARPPDPAAAARARDAKSRYARNTAILESELEDRHGGRVRITELLAGRNAFGLLSEDIHPETGALWGNIPQTYSIAGIINSAMRLSVRREDLLCRVSS
jgi:GH15 family glucan-1,4-alpha-glucosidase